MCAKTEGVICIIIYTCKKSYKFFTLPFVEMEMSNICEDCKEEKETDICCNETRWGKECAKDICESCYIFCERCDKNPKKICKYCVITCNKCNKNICYRCEEKYGRCEKCWQEFPLCDFCENVEAGYQCDLCYKEVCYNHKKICYNCGTKCMDCHEYYYKASCEDCRDDLSPENVEEPTDSEDEN